MSEKKYTVCVDFDGVLHAYTSPWVNAHTIPDPPVVGAIEWLWNMVQKFEVVIFSTRCKTLRGRWAMTRWLRKYAGNLYHEDGCGGIGIEDVKFSKSKPPALIYLDDRAIRFTGPDSWPTADDVHRARPWNKP